MQLQNYYVIRIDQVVAVMVGVLTVLSRERLRRNQSVTDLPKMKENISKELTAAAELPRATPFLDRCRERFVQVAKHGGGWDEGFREW